MCKLMYVCENSIGACFTKEPYKCFVLVVDEEHQNAQAEASNLNALLVRMLDKALEYLTDEQCVEVFNDIPEDMILDADEEQLERIKKLVQA